MLLQFSRKIVNMWFIQRRSRILVAGIALLSGLLLGIILQKQNVLLIAVEYLAIGLALLLGLGKLASP